MFEGVLFSRLLEAFICGSFIWKCWRKVSTEKYCPVSLFSVVRKVFEKLVSDRIVKYLEKCGLFSDFQYGSRSSWLPADLLTVVSDRIARAFNRSGAIQAVTCDKFKALETYDLSGFKSRINRHLLTVGSL